MNAEYNENNVFAKIIKKQIKAEIILENEFIISFHDINPRAKVHVLILPKNKYTDIYDFSNSANKEEKEAIFEAFKIIIEKFNLKSSGSRIITNHGTNGRQEVPHLHFHLLGGNDVGKMIT